MERMNSLESTVQQLYGDFGQRKPMGISAPSIHFPHYFLLRTFLSQNDLLIIFNTKRCRYQCYFCQLPAKSSKEWIGESAILAQFEHVITEIKHSLSIIDRITISNEGSILDSETFPTNALLTIGKCINELRRIRTLVLETRLEFVDIDTVRQLYQLAPRIKINFLTGFETQDQQIRDKVLFKKEPLNTFLTGLDRIAETNSELTSYVLYKPSPTMSDEGAFTEAEATINFLASQCHQREIPLTIRLNPMYVAQGSKWAKIAKATQEYAPPRLTDVMKLAEKKAQEGIEIYIGLSTEGLSGSYGTYESREDYSPSLIRQVISFNNRKIREFS